MKDFLRRLPLDLELMIWDYLIDRTDMNKVIRELNYNFDLHRHFDHDCYLFRGFNAIGFTVNGLRFYKYYI